MDFIYEQCFTTTLWLESGANKEIKIIRHNRIVFFFTCRHWYKFKYLYEYTFFKSDKIYTYRMFPNNSLNIQVFSSPIVRLVLSRFL